MNKNNSAIPPSSLFQDLTRTFLLDWLAHRWSEWSSKRCNAGWTSRSMPCNISWYFRTAILRVSSKALKSYVVQTALITAERLKLFGFNLSSSDPKIIGSFIACAISKVRKSVGRIKAAFPAAIAAMVPWIRHPITKSTSDSAFIQSGMYPKNQIREAFQALPSCCKRFCTSP